MLVYCVTTRHPYPMYRFIETWGKSIESEVRIVAYEDLRNFDEPPNATWVFSDLERISSEQHSDATKLAADLEERGRRVLNHPGKVLRRFDLLQTLQARGINKYAVYSVREPVNQFPAFIRARNDHRGALSEPLRTEAELNERLSYLVSIGKDPDELMIVEYLETADPDGIYRKYACFLVGDFFIPRHLLFSHKWVTKKPDLINPALAHEETVFLEGDPHPHEADIRKIFEIAGINYGRIDYGVIEGKIVVWEINTNPIITIAGPDLAPERYDAQANVAEKLCYAFKNTSTVNQPITAGSRGARLVSQFGRRLARAFFT